MSDNPFAYLNDTKGNDIFSRYVSAVSRDADISEIIELVNGSIPQDDYLTVDKQRNYWYMS